MRGINIKNFCESLEYYADLVFEYNGKQYQIEPNDMDDEICSLTVWTAEENVENICIVKEINTSKSGIAKEVINKVLNTKCFEGKSFFEIYNDIQIIDWG